MSKYALCKIGGALVEGWPLRNSETGILADVWHRFKMTGYYSDQAVREAIKQREYEVRAVSIE